MSKIEWTDQTWNPIIGCSKISPGCDNCYAELMANRLGHIALKQLGDDENLDLYGIGNYTEVINPEGKWNGQTRFVHDALEKPLKRKKPTKYFVCSMGDLFHESVPFWWIDRVMEVIKHCPQHTFQILTKRPEKMKRYFDYKYVYAGLPNLWLGVSAENQEQADKRIPILLQIPAAKRFVSIEPMLGEIDLNKVVFERVYGTGLLNALTGNKTDYYGGAINGTNKLDWVILGGESGHKARPMHPDWVRSIRDQCKEANIPFFFKQWGEFQEGSHRESKSYIVINNGDFGRYDSSDLTKKYGGNWQNCQATVMAKVGKKKAGRLLDGKEYNKFPKI